MRRRMMAVVALMAVFGMLGTGPAWAGHDHFIVTPAGCHQVAQGQTGITDPGHGGYHRYHFNVHLGATESTTSPDNLGDGHSPVQIFKDACP
ncbi:MAG: hypothetical protein Q8Q52_06165 [Acidimicrobiia bacterium]|nr:hypothetical protein [Acidimicrobiia bacterium]